MQQNISADSIIYYSKIQQVINCAICYMSLLCLTYSRGKNRYIIYTKNCSKCWVSGQYISWYKHWSIPIQMHISAVQIYLKYINQTICKRHTFWIQRTLKSALYKWHILPILTSIMVLSSTLHTNISYNIKVRLEKELLIGGAVTCKTNWSWPSLWLFILSNNCHGTVGMVHHIFTDAAQ